jgi:hypothetical protein
MIKWRTLLVMAIIGLAIALVVVLAAPHFSATPAYGLNDSARVAYLLVYALVISGTVWASLRKQGWTALRYVAIWLAVGGLIALLYLALYHKAG